MKIEITLDVIQEMIGLFGKEGAIRELQATINELIIEAVDEAEMATKRE
jgi:hypothetical protein